MNAAAKLLDRLDKVRQVAPGRWMAQCPAHQDKSPSLSIRELDDGRILLHDFGAGCAAGDILASIGLTLSDLFPEKHSAGLRAVRPNHWHATREALRTLHREVLIVAIAAENIAGGCVLDDADRALVIDAAAKIRATAEACR